MFSTDYEFLKDMRMKVEEGRLAFIASYDEASEK